MKSTFTLGQIENTLLKTHEIKTHRHFVKIGVFSIDDNCVWPPDLRQRFPVERDLRDSTGVELKSWVRPGLPEVAVETVHLVEMMVI